MTEEKAKNAAALEKGANKFPAITLSTFNSWMDKFAVFQDNLIKQFKGGRNHLDIKVINTFLSVCICILGVYFIQNFIISLRKINNIKFAIPSSVSRQAGSSQTTGLKALTFYIEKLKKRDIFRMGPKSSDVAEVISSKAAEATKNLRLVGISWSQDPDVMIEDTKSLKTFFVKKGQIIGDIKVETVYKDKVVLRYGEEIIELR